MVNTHACVTCPADDSRSPWLRGGGAVSLVVMVLAVWCWCPGAAMVYAQRSLGSGFADAPLPQDDQPEVIPAGPSLSATDEMVTDIRVVGARVVPHSRVLAQLQTRIGRPYDPQLVQRDVKKLYALPWFVNVETYTEKSAEGRVVIFNVTERPTIRYVEYLGNNSIRDKTLAKETGLVVGGSISPYQVEEGRSRIEQLYKENGFNRVQVQVVEGNNPDDQGVVYHINEGKAQKIWSVEFIGNRFASDGRLKTKIQSKPGFARIFKGYVDYESINADVQRLTSYYRRFGYFQAKVDREIEWNDDETWATIRFVINEGPRSAVRNVRFLGNELFATEDLHSGLRLAEGQQFEQDRVTGDVEWLKELYGSRGYVFADISADVRYLEEPGKVDLVYSVKEGQRFRVGRIFVHIGGENPHTQIHTALNRLSIKPGEVMDIREVRASERRLQASSLFHTDPMRNVYPKISFRIPEDDREVFQAGEQPMVRGQTPGEPLRPVPGQAKVYEVQRPNLAREADEASSSEAMDVHLYFDDGHLGASGGRPEAPPPQAYEVRKPAVPGAGNPYQNLNVRSTNPYQVPPAERPVVRGQSPGGSSNSIGWTSGSTAAPRSVPPQVAAAGGQAVRATGPASAPASGNSVQPAQYVNQIQPPGLPSQPLPPPNSAILPFPATEPIVPGTGGLPTADPEVDVFVDLEETQTGRFLLGVGINSDAGVVGQILLDERNFDWRRAPRSWQDVVDGTAWRGAGQRLRLEAAPGSQVQRYLVNFQEPFVMGTPVSMGISGSYFDRRFEDWDEQRLGGRLNFGYQWVQSDVSTNFSYRGENVQVRNPTNPAEPQLAEVLGDNVLHGFRAAIINDTRDSAFLATQGHYFEVYGEQVVGTFDYPRGGFDLRKYFLVRERADHSGRHVVSVTTKMDVSGTNTPIYDQFFAGGFSTMRGFDFRGASPVSNNVQVGGEFRWLNSAEYMFPLTADDMLHGVVFCDFGTVEPRVDINDFRVAPGVGLRITVPAMGPAPIALDFAWPVTRADTDDLQVFSFNIGFLR